MRAIDADGSGTLTRDEIKKMLIDFQLLKHTNYYSGVTLGDLSMAVIDTLLDFCDDSGDGVLQYNEFIKVLASDNIMYLPCTFPVPSLYLPCTFKVLASDNILALPGAVRGGGAGGGGRGGLRGVSDDTKVNRRAQQLQYH